MKLKTDCMFLVIFKASSSSPGTTIASIFATFAFITRQPLSHRGDAIVKKKNLGNRPFRVQVNYLRNSAYNLSLSGGA